jgi:hypothetical protein
MLALVAPHSERYAAMSMSLPLNRRALGSDKTGRGAQVKDIVALSDHDGFPRIVSCGRRLPAKDTVFTDLCRCTSP